METKLTRRDAIKMTAGTAIGVTAATASEASPFTPKPERAIQETKELNNATVVWTQYSGRSGDITHEVQFHVKDSTGGEFGAPFMYDLHTSTFMNGVSCAEALLQAGIHKLPLTIVYDPNKRADGFLIAIQIRVHFRS